MISHERVKDFLNVNRKKSKLDVEACQIKAENSYLIEKSKLSYMENEQQKIKAEGYLRIIE